MTLWSVASPGHVQALVILVLLLDITDTAEQIPPSIIFPTRPTKKVMVPGHAEERIKCRASGYPPPKYFWLHDKSIIDPTQSNVKMFANGDLVLVKFVAKNNGIYQCLAINSLGTAVSNELQILALYYPKSDSTSSPKIYRVSFGQPFSIPCDKAVDTVPEMDRKWYFNRMSPVIYSKRIGMDAHGTLHAAHATNQERVYICQLVPRRSDVTRRNVYEQGKITIVKEREPFPVRQKPEFEYFSEIVKAQIGHKATLECFFGARLPPDITWKNEADNKMINNSSRPFVTDFGRKLIFTQVRDQDQGLYTCTGTNSYGKTSATLFLNVTTPPLPVANASLKTQTVPENTEVTLHCETRAAPGERNDPPIWFRNFRLLDKTKLPDKTRYTFSRDMTRLKITSLSKTADTACFQCNVSNSEGFLFSDSYLRVINSIRVTKSPPYLVNIVPGDVIDVEVRAKGDDCCSLNMLWKYQKQPIRPEEWPVFDTDKKSGRILFNSSLGGGDVLTNYLGVYTVRVSNQYQSVDVVFEIRIRGKGESSWLFASYENWWPGLLVLLLLAICAIFGYAAHRIRKNRFKSFQSADTETQKPTDLPEEQLSGLASESQIADQTVESEESRSDIGESVVESSVDDESFV